MHAPNVHSSSIYNGQVMEQPKCSLTEEWMKKTWCIYTIDYSAMKKKDMMPFAATGRDLEMFTVNDVSQKEKGKYHKISPNCGI